MIPVIIIVKIAEILGLVFWLTVLLEPLLKFIGLPAEMALGLTTTILTNPYAGLHVFASTPETMQLTVAQTTIIASFMLFTHSLVLEAAISSKAGLRECYNNYYNKVIFWIIILCIIELGIF